VVILGLGLAGALMALKRAQHWAEQQRKQGSVAAPIAAVEPGQPSSSLQEQTNTSAPNSFSLQGLEPSDVTIQKTMGSSLIYAVGTITNTTDRQRFGVKVELELSDALGRKLGNASDYRQVLEAGAQWNFKALIVDSKTVSAKISSIREDQ
jgi:hypothetical protein